MVTDLLPPQATPFERALERSAAARLAAAAIDLPFEMLKNPAHCPVDLLPFLAWEWGAQGWDADWTDAVKRAAAADAIRLARIRGSVQSVADVIARRDRLARLVEWFDAVPPREPGTFEVIVPIDSGDDVRGTADFARAIITDVIWQKPLSAQFLLAHHLALAARLGAVAAVRTALFGRLDMAIRDDRTRDWDNLLTTEIGEPLETEDGALLEIA